jgi:hypothetical protein
MFDLIKISCIGKRYFRLKDIERIINSNGGINKDIKNGIDTLRKTYSHDLNFTLECDKLVAKSQIYDSS